MGDISGIPTVIVTGFGPFRGYVKNSSWLTVQELAKLDIQDFRIITKELPVEYETVSKEIPRLWETYNPMLVVHCGMSGQAHCLTLEKFANNKFYYGNDIRGRVPSSNCCCTDGPDMICTNLDIQKILDDVKSSDVCVKAVASEDAGMYLCEFSYYVSLNINRNAAFIHVPPIDEPYSAKEMSKTLAIIIRSMLKQIQS